MEPRRITVGDFLDEVASKFPEHQILIDVPKGIRYSYREFLRAVNRVAKGFLSLGVKKGEHLALWAPNLSEWIITELAVMKIGAVLISVDTHVQLPQLEYLLRQSDSRFLVMAEGLTGSEYIEMVQQLCPGLVRPAGGQLRCSALPELKSLVLLSDQGSPRAGYLKHGGDREGLLSWRKIQEMAETMPESTLAERQRSCHCDDIVSILYTSGTTGSPKGVMSTHYGVINTTLASAENQKLTENDRLCLSVPLSHMFGCICVTLAGLFKGAAIVIPSETFIARKVLEAIERERCTAVYGSPGSFIAMMEDPQYRTFDIRSLRTGIMGGAQCPMEVMRKVVGEMGAREIVIGYGQTEASSWITETRPDDTLELRVSTVGKPLSHVEVKIVDCKSGEEVPSGVVGEICARGFNMKGYYKMPAATASAIDSGGWLHTGDMGTIDEKGYVRTTGRLKEVIRKGEEIIYPTEVEEVLFAHPKVLNVQVFGVPDKRIGEEVATWIRLQDGVTADVGEIIEYCQGRIPGSHIPRYVKFVHDFPMTPLGKVQKFKMRELAIEEYGL